METLTQERLKELLHYDPETGVFRWRYAVAKHIKPWDVAGCLHKPTGYLGVKIEGKVHRSHRLAWLYVYGYFPPCCVDHVDRDKLNNKINNLREATYSENLQNMCMPRNNTSGFIGATLHTSSGRWRSFIRVNKKQKFLGYFDTPEAAHEAYKAAKAKYHTFNPTV